MATTGSERPFAAESGGPVEGVVPCCVELLIRLWNEKLLQIAAVRRVQRLLVLRGLPLQRRERLQIAAVWRVRRWPACQWWPLKCAAAMAASWRVWR
jgi:hypothetical protein